jgi:hypothetical protein
MGGTGFSCLTMVSKTVTGAQILRFRATLILHYVKMTWVYDRFSAVPYLRFLGDARGGCGMTRMAEVTAQICYKAIFGGVATTPAILFRLVHQYRVTLFTDEADYSKSDLPASIIQVLNCGYECNGVVPRCDKDNNVEVFRVFGPKILTNRRRFTDPSLETWCMTLEIRGKPRIRSNIELHLHPEIFGADARGVRNKLLTWRFRNYWQINWDEKKLRETGLDPRAVEIGMPHRS